MTTTDAAPGPAPTAPAPDAAGTAQPRRVAVVTGAGTGLGREFAAELHRHGFSVALLGRDQAKLRATAAEITRRETGVPGAATLARDRLLVVPADVTDEPSVAAAFATVQVTWGRVDLLVNNAGVFGPHGSAADITADDFDATLATNVRGAFLCAREAMRAMRAQHPIGGRIINNGSVSAQVPRPASVAYTVSKHALTGLTRSIALDGRRDRIACGQIDIGNAETAMSGAVVNAAMQADGTVREEPTFDARHVARALGYMATLPLDANVLFLTVTASGMPFVGRG